MTYAPPRQEPRDAAGPAPDFVFNATVLGLYIAVASIGALSHQMWRDELQAWLIARDSPTPWAIIGNLRYDGHPPLWYFVMWPIARLTWNPDAMKLASLASAVGGVALFLWRGPWSRLEKALWPFGFYILFEYGVKTRSYNLGVFLLMLFCALWPARRERIVAIGLVLGLMANVHIYFGLLAAAGALALAIDRWQADGWRGLRPGGRDMLAVGITAALGLFAAFVAAPPARGDFSAPTPIPPVSALTAMGKIAIPASFLVDIGIPGGIAVAAYLLGLGVAAWCIAGCLRRALVVPASIGFLGVALAGLFAFFLCIYPADNQHAGLLLLAIIGGEWIRRMAGPVAGRAGASGSSAVRGSAALAALLACQAAMGLLAVGAHLSRPYSHGKDVAAYIRAQGWAGDPVAGLGGPLTTICGYLEKPWCYYAERGRRSSYLVFDSAPGAATDTSLTPEKLARLAGDAAGLGRSVTFIVPGTWPDFPEAMAQAGFRRVREFSGATVENYAVYRKEF